MKNQTNDTVYKIYEVYTKFKQGQWYNDQNILCGSPAKDKQPSE